jgi:hypothetical protein
MPNGKGTQVGLLFASLFKLPHHTPDDIVAYKTADTGTVPEAKVAINHLFLELHPYRMNLIAALASGYALEEVSDVYDAEYATAAVKLMNYYHERRTEVNKAVLANRITDNDSFLTKWASLTAEDSKIKFVDLGKGSTVRDVEVPPLLYLINPLEEDNPDEGAERYEFEMYGITKAAFIRRHQPLP